MEREVTVQSPATVSNVVCGFDCLGFALEEPFDLMTLRKTAEPRVRIVHRDDFGLSTDPQWNVAGVALQAIIDSADLDHGFEIEITKKIKPGSGIGSSSASSCGAVVAADILLGKRFSNAELIEFAMAGEMLASRSRHADNIAPCLFGGFTLVRSSDPVDIISLEYPPLFAAVIHPQIEISTAVARSILPDKVSLGSAVQNWSNLGAFVAALQRGDLDLLGRSMKDEIVEPVRGKLIPKFRELRKACLDAGALGGGISGSGPSMFMLSRDENGARNIADVMQETYRSSGLEFNIYVSPIASQGVRQV